MNKPTFKNNEFRYMPSKVIEDSLIVSDGMGFVNSENFQITRDTFNNYVLVYVIDGTFCLNQYDKVYYLKKNQGAIISLYDFHDYYGVKGEVLKMKWFHFRGESIRKIMNRLTETKNLPLCFTDETFIEEIDEFFDVRTKREDGFEYDISRLIYNMVLKKAKPVLIEFSKNNAKENIWFTDTLIKYIDRNVHRKITIEDLSEQVSLKPNYFNKAFKKYFNLPPHQLILQRKLDFSIELLLFSDNSISEIAQKLAFSDQSHYSKAFKKHFGTTPLNYKKSIGK